jgi:hypothetical protein
MSIIAGYIILSLVMTLFLRFKILKKKINLAALLFVFLFSPLIVLFLFAGRFDI